nr:amidohydrolase family protein [Bacteroidales bacterium]
MKKILLTFLFFISIVTIKAQTDVHVHIICDEYYNALKKHQKLNTEGIPTPVWDVEQLNQFMSQVGIATTVISMPSPHPYFGDINETVEICRAHNLRCAELKKQNPKKIKFSAALPLPDIQKAIEEAKFAIEKLHADAISLPSNSNGKYLGNSDYQPLMEYLNSQKVVILTHPQLPEPVNPEFQETIPLYGYGYMLETTQMVLNLIANDVMT